jgi:hypothetical protein
MSDEERAIWTAAAHLVERHGEAAKAVAQREAARCCASENPRRGMKWLRVVAATVELLRTAEQGESVN